MRVSNLESQPSTDFKELLGEAIDAALAQLGDSSRRAFYLHLKINYNIMKRDIPEKIDEFTIAVEKVFGQRAKILEIEIMKNLFAKIGSNFKYFPKKDDLFFVEYIDAARMHVQIITRTICCQH